MLISMLPGMAAFAENAAPELINGFYQLDSADDLFWFAKRRKTVRPSLLHRCLRSAKSSRF